MNERIFEIVQELNGRVGLLWTEIDKEELAQLIVRECAEVAHCNFHVDGLTLGNIMKEHFGVEE